MTGEHATWDLEFWLRARDGGYRWIRGKGRVVQRGDGGEPLRAAGTHQDVTPRVLGRRALAESEARYRSLVENLPGVV